MDTLDFGSYVRQLRKSRGLGLREAAPKLGINPSYLSRIENNTVPPPSRDVLAAMAKLYKVPIADLIAQLDSERTDLASLDPVAAALYRIAMSAPASDRIKMLEKAVEGLNLPPEKKQWWQDELNRLRAELRLAGGSGLLREWKGTNDLYDQYAIPRRLRATTIENMALTKLRAFCNRDLATYVPPTPIEQLIESVEEHVDIVAFGAEVGGRFPDGSPRVLGRCRWKADDRLEIGIDERLFDAPKGSPECRRGNFTLGHEYFHGIEHLPLLRQHFGLALNRDVSSASVLELNKPAKKLSKRLVSNEDWREYQANVFSAAILMPAHSVRNEFRTRFGEDVFAIPPDEFDDTRLELAQWSSSTVASLTDLFDVNPRAMAIRLETLGLVILED